MRGHLPTIQRIKHYLRSATLIVAALALAFPLPALAEYNEGAYANNEVLFYDPRTGTCAGTGTAATILKGDTPEEKVWNFFAEKTLTAEQAAGVMGNIEAESHFNPAAIEGSNGVGFGIVQWSYERRTAIEQAAALAGRSASDLAFQLDYLHQELLQRQAEGYSSQWDGITKQESAEDAVVFFHHKFEISYLINFDLPPGSPGRERAISIAGRDYPDSRTAVLDERGGFDTPDGKVANGSRGAAWFLKEFGGKSAGDCSGAGDKMVHPIADGTNVNEGFGGPREFGSVSCNGITPFHLGYDLAGQENVTKVVASHGGTVTVTNDYNNLVRITHPDGFSTEYLHMNDSQILVKTGDSVVAGQEIGTVGNTGFSSGPHLHFQVDLGSSTLPKLADLTTFTCNGGHHVNPALFMRKYNVELCPSGSCDHAQAN